MKRFWRSYYGRGAVALVLIGIISLSYWWPLLRDYQREQRVVDQITAAGGTVEYTRLASGYLFDLFPFSLANQLTERVVRVRFDGKISQDLIKQLSTFEQLESFDATNVDLTEIDLSVLKSCPKLYDIGLVLTQFGDSQMARLQGLTRLESLRLSRTQITDVGLDQLQDMKLLASLQLANTRISDAGLETLQRMGFHKLATLDLCGTGIGDVGLIHLKGSSVGYLDLRETAVTEEGLKALKGLPQLVTLLLSGKQIGDTGLEKLAGLPIQYLIVRDSGVTDQGIKSLRGLPKLISVDLTNSQITDHGLQDLKTMTNLTEIQLGQTATTEEGRMELRKALPNCIIYPDP